MEQIEKLNKKLKLRLNGRRIVDERKNNVPLTLDELLLIEFFITTKWKSYSMPVIVPISASHHLDFIGWDNDEYMDVLICKTGKFRVGV